MQGVLISTFKAKHSHDFGILICQWGQGPANRSLHSGWEAKDLFTGPWPGTKQYRKAHSVFQHISQQEHFGPSAIFGLFPCLACKMPGNSSASGSKPGFGNILEIENWLKPYVSDPGFMSMYPADRSYAKRDADTLSSNNFEKMVREGSYILTKI